MATPPSTNPNPIPTTYDKSYVKEIGAIRRAEEDARNRYRASKQYDRNSSDIYSEGINGDNYGKQPATNPQSYEEAYPITGSKDDITARIGSTSPGSLSKNKYWAGGNKYDNVEP